MSNTSTQERLLKLRTRLSESVASQVLRLSNLADEDLVSPAETAMLADTRAAVMAVNEVIENLQAAEPSDG